MHIGQQVQKEPWEMTSDEYAAFVGYKKSQGSRVRENWRGQHEGIVRIALIQGKPVPPEVLKDYPELLKQKGMWKMPHTGSHVDQTAEVLGKIKKPDEQIDLEQFKMGLKVEEEHGPRENPDLDVTGGDPITTGKIALAHLREDPEYYTYLAKMEEEGKQRKQRAIVEAIEAAGAIPAGFQPRSGDKPPLVMFNDPQTKVGGALATLYMDPLVVEITAETVREKLRASREKFRAAST